LIEKAKNYLLTFGFLIEKAKNYLLTFGFLIKNAKNYLDLDLKKRKKNSQSLQICNLCDIIFEIMVLFI